MFVDLHALVQVVGIVEENPYRLVHGELHAVDGTVAPPILNLLFNAVVTKQVSAGEHDFFLPRLARRAVHLLLEVLYLVLEVINFVLQGKVEFVGLRLHHRLRNRPLLLPLLLVSLELLLEHANRIL